MTFAAINWLSISINLLLVIFVIVCLLMTLLILMQRPKQEGLGAAFGGGVTDQVFGARTTNVLQRGTVYLGSMFFILSLVLAILIGHQNKQKKLLNDVTPAKVEVAVPEAPKEPALPKSLTEELPAEVKMPADSPAEAPADAPAPATPVESAPAPAVPTEATAPAAPVEAAPPAAPVETAPPAPPVETEAPKEN